jgi:hypothetical protein
MGSVAKKQANGRPERLSPERLAELTHPPKYRTLEERRTALRQATEGFRVKVRVTPDTYGRLSAMIPADPRRLASRGVVAIEEVCGRSP